MQTEHVDSAGATRPSAVVIDLATYRVVQGHGETREPDQPPVFLPGLLLPVGGVLLAVYLAGLAVAFACHVAREWAGDAVATKPKTMPGDPPGAASAETGSFEA